MPARNESLLAALSPPHWSTGLTSPTMPDLPSVNQSHLSLHQALRGDHRHGDRRGSGCAFHADCVNSGMKTIFAKPHFIRPITKPRSTKPSVIAGLARTHTTHVLRPNVQDLDEDSRDRFAIRILNVTVNRTKSNWSGVHNRVVAILGHHLVSNWSAAAMRSFDLGLQTHTC